MRFKLSRYIHTSKDEDTLPDRFFLYATRTGAAVEIDNKHYDPLINEEWNNLPTNILDNLLSVEAIVPYDEDELLSLLQQNKENIRDNDKKFLSYTIQPTANCQLGCHYCGQQHTKLVSNSTTNKAICDRIIDKMEELKETLHSLSISWYGGEPLTGLSSIYEMSDILIQYCQENGIEYSANMVTNGLSLKKSTFEKLVRDYKITGYQITLDGTAEFHDLRRMLKTGGASFDVIFNNLKEILHSEFFAKNPAVISIRSNVDAQNKENVFDLIDMMHENDMLNKVSFNTAAIHDWGDNKATTVNGISKDDYAMFEIDVFLKLRELGALPKESGIIPIRTYNVCMVANQNSEVFDAHGNVSTCWEVPYTPMYDNTDFYSGNLLKDEVVDTSKAPMRAWFDEIPTNNSWCKSCKFLPVCGGSCPKHWYNNTVACPSFKQNIDERLFLSKLIKAETASN
jgi:uncharacterized protein